MRFLMLYIYTWYERPMTKDTKSVIKFFLIVSGSVAALVIALSITIMILLYDDVDRCLDRGGGWNYETESCEGLP